MRMYTAIAVGLALAASMASSQKSAQQTETERSYLSGTLSYSTANLPQAKKGFLWNLKSDNEGAVESALAHITQMRIVLPQEEMKEIETALSQLASSGRTQVIRYKAYLATQVFASPGLFQKEAAAWYESGDEFFSAIAARLERTMLGLNVN